MTKFMNLHTHTHTYKSTRTLSLFVCLFPGMSTLRKLIHCSTQNIATYCNTPQHTATPSNTLQHTATRMWPHKRTRHVALYHVMYAHDHIWSCVYTARLHQVANLDRGLQSLLQRTTTHIFPHPWLPCNTLQHTATHCITLYIPFTLYLPTENPRMSLSPPPSSSICLQ